MKKKLILTAVSLILSVFISEIFAQEREVSPVQLKVISEQLYLLQGGRGANGGVFIGDTGVLVIDAKMDKASVDKTLEEIKKITDLPIKYLVSTHGDKDHTYGNRYFPKDTIFIAHENCRKEFFSPDMHGTASDWNKPELLPFLPSVTYRDKMDIYLGSDKVELWYFGVGHTTGDTVVYFPDEKVAFIGDQIFMTRPQLIHSYKGGNSFGHVKNLEKMLEALPAEKFCSGHSGIVGRDAITKHIEQMKQRQQKVKSLIEQNKTLEQIKAEFKENERRLIESIYNEIINVTVQ